jgi:hypothetical protein
MWNFASGAEMADKPDKPFFIWWDELDSRNMPALCVNCGRKAQWTKILVETTQMDRMARRRVYRETQGPFCENHRTTETRLNPAHLKAHACTLHGVWAKELDARFLEALKKHRESGASQWKEQNKGKPANVPNESLPPGLRTEPEMPNMSLTSNPMMWVFGAVLGVVLLVMLCGVCAIGSMMLIPVFMR